MTNKVLIVVFGIIAGSFVYIAKMILAITLIFCMVIFSTVDTDTNIAHYHEYMGANAREEYRSKWGMDETIFPENITENMNVLDYKMVYYNPWDAQYLSYLVVEYDEKDYQQEVKRLKEYSSTEYIGYYTVTGFTNYTLLAMYADEYNGFVYAITNNENRIIYVELIFCNYFYDLDYKSMIPEEYLPDGFDATLDNPYSKTKQ